MALLALRNRMQHLRSTTYYFPLASSSFHSSTTATSKAKVKVDESKFILADPTVRIGCASGFWGDTSVAAPQLVHNGNINFLVLDYLSEITMSLLTAVNKKYPTMGYTPDFVQVVVGPLLKTLKQKGIRVISNAGGVNPRGCADAIHSVAKQAGIDDLKLAVVIGDDLMPQKDDIHSKSYNDLDSGMSMPKEMQSMTAYLGAGPICSALDSGADIVITGRCTDSALILAPLMHKFKWSATDYDKLASGSLAGHLIECGAQCTGGNFTDWKKVPNWHNIGFPIAECSSNGDFVITKPDKTGGLVNFGTVAEQLVYEIGNPSAYVLPDVVCDFTNVKVNTIPGKEDNSVFVSGVKGKPPTDTYKVSATYSSGYRSTAVSCVGGKNPQEKGKKTAEETLKRVQGMYKFLGLPDFSRTHIHTIGNNDWQGSQPPEAVTWLAVEHEQKKALEIFSREIAPAGTGMAPGLSAIIGGRPKVSPVFRLFSFLYPKDQVKVEVEINGNKICDYVAPTAEFSDNNDTRDTDIAESNVERGSHNYTIEQLAFTRSGDKGNNCNIGVIARHPSFVPYLRELLTEEVVQQYFIDVFDNKNKELKKVLRYDLPGIGGFNFLLKASLGGGGIASLRTDPQGKAYGQRLLDLTLTDLPNFDDVIAGL